VTVHIKIPQPWDMPEHQITPEALYWNRRQILRAMGLTGVGLAGVLAGCKSNQEVEQQIQQRAQTLPKLSAPRNGSFSLDRPLTEEKVAAHYNPTASFNSLPNVLVHKSAVTARSWLTSGTLRWSWTPSPPSPQVMELLVVKLRFENNYLLQKLFL